MGKKVRFYGTKDIVIGGKDCRPAWDGELEGGFKLKVWKKHDDGIPYEVEVPFALVKCDKAPFYFFVDPDLLEEVEDAS